MRKERYIAKHIDECLAQQKLHIKSAKELGVESELVWSDDRVAVTDEGCGECIGNTSKNANQGSLDRILNK